MGKRKKNKSTKKDHSVHVQENTNISFTQIIHSRNGKIGLYSFGTAIAIILFLTTPLYDLFVKDHLLPMFMADGVYGDEYISYSGDFSIKMPNTQWIVRDDLASWREEREMAPLPPNFIDGIGFQKLNKAQFTVAVFEIVGDEGLSYEIFVEDQIKSLKELFGEMEIDISFSDEEEKVIIEIVGDYKGKNLKVNHTLELINSKGYVTYSQITDPQTQSDSLIREIDTMWDNLDLPEKSTP